MITRPKERNAEFAKKIIALGGIPIEVASIEVTEPSDHAEIDKALSLLPDYDWAVYTSANGVERFFKRILEKKIDLKRFRGRIAAVGPLTAKALAGHGLGSPFIPSSYLTEKLASDLPDVAGKRVLLVRAQGVNMTMSKILRSRGALVHEVYAYRVQRARNGTEIGKFDAVVFTSPSSVRGFTQIIHRDSSEVSRGARICCIGPVTAEAARKLGYDVHLVAKEHTVEGLLEELVKSMEALLV